MALCSCSKLSTSFLPTQNALSSSDAFFSALLYLPFSSHHEQYKQKQQQQQQHCVTATAATTTRPRKGNRIMTKEGRPLPPRRRLSGLRDAILKPPLDDSRLADKFLRSPQLSLKTLPLLSSCLPHAPLRAEDEEWMEENFPEIKEALGYPLPGMEKPASPDSPLFHLDTLLFLAFQHPESVRGKAKYVRVGHSRLAFLGEHVLGLALVEFFLLRYPRETPACMRERIFGLINKKVLPQWIRSASLDGPIFPNGMDTARTDLRLQSIRGVFWALVGALYLCMGMGEVYRLLFEVYGLDPDHKTCQPKPRLSGEDVDYVFAPFDEKQVEWNDLTTIKSPDDGLFAKPLLYRACVPPGMQRFRGNLWEIDSLPQVLQIMGYPLPTLGEDPAITMARNAELELGLQLCFTHPSMYKVEHPRFCNERFEYLGSKIQDVVMAEKLLMKHLDAPGFFIAEKHRRILFNRVCGKYFREKKLQKFIMYSEARQELFDKARRLRNFATTGVSLALHGFGYTVYGKAEVRRIMFELFDFERLQMPL